MGTVVQQQGREALQAGQKAGSGSVCPPPPAGSDGRQTGISAGDQVHVRLTDGDGVEAWSRFPWTIVEVRRARDGGDQRLVVAPPHGESTYIAAPNDVRPWAGYGNEPA
jgi:hypothetical protein